MIIDIRDYALLSANVYGNSQDVRDPRNVLPVLEPLRMVGLIGGLATFRRQPRPIFHRAIPTNKPQEKS
jgi:hypothetical protein